MERSRTWVMSGLIATVLCAAAWAALPAEASAQKRVAVSAIKGRGGAIVRGGVVRALKDEGDVAVVGNDEVSRAAERLGVGVRDGRSQISAELGVAAWLEGEVERSGRQVALTLSVVNAFDGAALGVVSYEAKNPKLLAKRVERVLWRDIADLVAQAEAPERAPEPVASAQQEPFEPEPEPALAAADDEEEEAEDDEPAQEQDDDGRAEGPSPLDVGVAFAAFSRSFDYNDDLSGLRTYDLGLGPTVMLKLRWYPAAHFDDGMLANLGVELRGQFAFGIDSAFADISFPTSSRALGGGVRARIPIDAHELAAVVGVANQTYAIDSASSNGAQVDPGIPSISYTYLRAGAEIRFALGDAFALGAAFAYLPTFGMGEIEDWFPRASASGVEGELSLTHVLSPSLELSAAFGLQRFAFSFNPELADAAEGRRIAGGALDQYLWGTVGARFLLGR